MGITVDARCDVCSIDLLEENSAVCMPCYGSLEREMKDTNESPVVMRRMDELLEQAQRLLYDDARFAVSAWMEDVRQVREQVRDPKLRVDLPPIVAPAGPLVYFHDGPHPKGIRHG
ncbi:MAG: hypothetical protein ACOC9T_00150 [Myxococcota bacterium]